MLQYGYRPNAPATPRTRRATDQDWVDYDPIVGRPPIRWPNNARLALWVCPAVLDYEFVPPHDPTALAAAVRTILTDTVVADRLSAAGPPVARRYPWSASAEQHREVYEQLARRRPDHAGVTDRSAG